MSVASPTTVTVAEAVKSTPMYVVAPPGAGEDAKKPVPAGYGDHVRRNVGPPGLLPR
jgi:hypothetical protein